jgi:hypothetical protein
MPVRSFGIRSMAAAAGLLLLASRPSVAWNEAGHITVAQLALRELKPVARARVIELLNRHPARESWVLPAGTAPSATDAFLIGKAAAWPDAIRSKDNPLHAENRPQAHYIDLPYAPDPAFPIPSGNTPEALAKELTIVKQLEWSEGILKDRTAAPDLRARALSWLIHLVGDIHQPLHCASLFSPAFPKGDRGGNDELVAAAGVTIKGGKDDINARLPNLHALWDDLPGNADSEGIAKAVIHCSSHKREEFSERLGHRDFGAWASESHELAVQEAYRRGTIEFVPLQVALSDLRSGKDVHIPAVPSGYMESAGATAERQIAIAAFRLADRLEALLGQ